MEDLLVKVTLQLITACKNHILSVQGDQTGNRLWEKDPQLLVAVSTRPIPSQPAACCVLHGSSFTENVVPWGGCYFHNVWRRCRKCVCV